MSNCEIFTPDEITKKMTDLLFKNFKNFNEEDYYNVLEPSVGTGNLLKYIFCNENININIDAFEIKKEYIQIFKKRYSEIIKNLNIYNEDFLKHNFKEKKYDLIISNPPYIKTQDLPIDYRQFLKQEYKQIFNNQSVLDIYYAFMIKCCLLLKEKGGVFVCITPNSYLFNSSAEKLRKFLFENKLVIEIIDYGHEKVFENVSVYCCITVIKKDNSKNLQKDFFIYNNQEKPFETFLEIKSKNKELKLKDICHIKNGIATLRNKVFIHDKKLYEDEDDCWVNVTNGSKDLYIIYPYYYDEQLNKTKCIKEEVFKQKYPKTYNFLLSKKEELLKRDKQNQEKYPVWYAYGRSQSIHLNPLCEKIIIPCLINPISLKDKKCIYLKHERMLHYNSISIEIKKEYNKNHNYTLDYIIQNCLINQKNINYLIEKSSKRSSGWLNLSTKTLGNFIIYS